MKLQICLGNLDCTDDQILFSLGKESFITYLKKKPWDTRFWHRLCS